MHLYKQRSARTHTRSQSGCIPEPLSGASVQCGALQPQGEAPASSPARAGQAEHLAPQKGHPHPHPSTPTAYLGVKEASPALPVPSSAKRRPASPMCEPRQPTFCEPLTARTPHSRALPLFAFAKKKKKICLQRFV